MFNFLTGLLFRGRSLFFNYSRYSKGKEHGLLQCEDVVPVQICTGPNDNYYEERNEACTVVYYPGEGKYHGYPIDNIVGNKDQVERVSEPQLDWNGVGRVFLLPSEPLGCMQFHNDSVNRPENHHPDKARKVRQNRSE